MKVIEYLSFILLINLVYADLQLIRSPLFILSTYEGVISNETLPSI